MAEKVYDKEIDKSIDWGGDEKTGNLPVKGNRVQEFIKNSLNRKIGLLYFDSTANRYLAFADEANRDIYLADTSKTELVLGTFDAPFNYSASIKLLTPQTVTIFKGATGNRIEFTFDTANKEGASVGEGIVCTYTFMRGATKKTTTVKYGYGEKVSMAIDDYLLEGMNTITISIQGQNTLAATTVSIIYRVISLNIEDDFNIAVVQDLTDGGQHSIEIPYTVTGQGTKTVEWYIDGIKQDFVKDEDEITEASSTRTKYLSITGFSHGRHSLQMRVSTSIDGEKYYSNILYREFMVVTEAYSKTTYLMVEYDIPSGKGIRGVEDEAILYGIGQYEVYTLRFAVYNPKNPASTPVNVIINGNTESTLNAPNGQVMESSFNIYIPGDITIKLSTEGAEYVMSSTVTGSSMNISEITAGLDLSFSASGRSNNSSDKNSWSDDKYEGTLSGFVFNETSGWVNDSLHINEGASFGINNAPLGNSPEVLGRTIEVSFRTVNVSDDNAVVCDLTKNGIGLKLTASEASLISREGRKVSTKFKSEEDVRVSFVINRKQGATNKGLAFIYVNGILSGAVRYAQSDSFESDAQLLIKGLAEAEVKLYQIRTYNSALSHDQILNNFILYQKSSKGMQDAYYRNDVLDDMEQLSVDKLQRFLPVMVITGNIPVLENTNNKKEQIIVDAEYTDLNNPEKSFKVKNAIMTPQGTSSMSYPKKNFRLYTCKLDDTQLFDWKGNIVKDRLYSFKENAQPVNTWCFKADYAESSGTHNTGIARLWNAAMYNARIDGEYKLRTAAQAAAVKNNYPYDVRTTVDGFPILMFYRLNADSDLVFIGKYNFNNDKSTESVFGFKDIPGFDNSKMQCWEVLNNGNHLALFQDTENWDAEWADAFEGRYPDGSEDTTDLKSFADWLVGCKDNAEAFKTEKWNHLDVYKVAAYYVYLMRFGAVDQPVKNAMFTSEDGVHFYYINYDNDTVLGVRNDGLLVYPPTITRQSLDTSYTTEVYAYAGHDSVLWNRLEADEEFMSIVSVVDNALYQAGLRYADVIAMFDDKQASKWCERIYNQDSQYKYIGPYVNDGIDNLYMLQGSRTSHRKWWLSRRFNLLDSMFVSGAYKSNVLECKLASAPAGLKFGITAGFGMDYGYGVNNIVVEKGVSLNIGESHEFTTKQVLNLGDPMRIYSANNLQGIDLSGLLKYLSTVNVVSVYDSVLGTRLKSLILGDGINSNSSLTEIQGLAFAQRLEVLNIEGCKGIGSLDLSKAYYFRELYAKKSGLKSVDLPRGAQKLTKLQLPASLQSLALHNLPALDVSGVSVEGNFANLLSVEIIGTPKCSTYEFVSAIVSKATKLQTLNIDSINWSCSAEQLITLVKDKAFAFDFKGHVAIDSIDQATIDQLYKIFGEHCFDKSSAFYITAPDSIFLTGPDEVLEGDTAKYSAAIFSAETGKGQIIYKISSGSRAGVSIDSNTGVLTTTENGYSDSSLTLMVQYIAPSGKVSSATKTINVKKRTYPTATEIGNAIIGSSSIENVDEVVTYTFSMPKGFTGRIASVEWVIVGDIMEQGYVEIQKQTNEYCKIILKKLPDTIINGSVKVILSKVIGGIIEGSKVIVAKNSTIAISNADNPKVMAIVYKAGWAANENYMTKTECALVTDSQFAGKFTSNSSIEHFDEFKYFTSISRLENKAFSGCSHLTSINIPEGVTNIGVSAFSGCSSLTSINIPEGVTSITDYVFRNCSSLTSINLPEGVTSIGDRAFYSCSSLTSINIPEGVTSIGDSAFYGCSSLTSINIPEGVTSIKDDTFNGCSSLTSINIPEGVTNIGNYVFRNCSSLTSINIPEGVTNIGVSAFSDCSSLTSINIPEGITSIYNYTFSGCSSLTSITIPEGVTNIGISAFNGCSSLTSITIPEGITSIGRSVFSNCSSLDIEVATNNKYYTSVNGVLFNKLKTVLLQYAKDKTQPDYILPEGVTSIGEYAFSGCSSLTSINIPEGVTSIGEYAFSGCSSLTSINIPGGVTNITDYVFNDCCSLTSINIPEGVTSIGSGAFSGCSSLTSINIPEGVTSINGDTFANCSSLTSITIPEGVTSIGKYALGGCVSLKTITCKAMQAPKTNFFTFVSIDWRYTGQNTRDTGENKLYVPVNATGYDSDRWLYDLCNTEKCGFTLMKTL